MKISILVVTFNHSQYIEKALESLLMQESTDSFEIIVADDCSTDNTAEIARRILEGRNNVHIYTNKVNLGITRNYEAGFSKCRGEYIFILEGDDYWTSPLKLRTVTKFMDNNPYCAMCSHPFFLKNDYLNILTPPVIDTEDDVTLFENKDLIMDTAIVSNFSTCCYRKSALSKISSAVFSVTSYEWMINIAIGQFGFLARINSPMSVYRISSNGAWAKKSEEQQLLDLIGIIDEYDEVLEYRYSEQFRNKKRLLSAQLLSIKKKKRFFSKR